MLNKKQKGFTLVELIISLTILGIFSLLAGQGFINILSSLNDLRAIGEEQEQLLYDNYVIDDYLSISESVKELTYNDNGDTNTGYLFYHKEKKYNYPFSFLSFDDLGDGYTKLYLKNILLLNDIVSFDSNVYYSEPGSNTIKNFETNSILNNVGTGVLNNPTGLLSYNGKLYIADTGSSCIREYSTTLSNCIVGQEGFPGDSSDLLIGPTYMVHDGTNMYISDSYQNKIRKVSLTNTGNIEDVFGNGDFGNSIGDGLSWTGITLTLPTGLALNGDKLYVADTGNNRILELNKTTGTGRVLLGNGEEETVYLGGKSIGVKNLSISSPTGLKISGDKLYFSESTTGIIKSYDLLTNTLLDELGNVGNLAYFGDFEKIDTGNSYSISGGSGEIVGEDKSIAYEGLNSLFITSENGGDVDFIYNFSGVTLKEDQPLSLSFALKTYSGSYNINYGGTDTNIFDSSFLTGAVTKEWSYFNLKYITNSLKNGIKITIKDTSIGDMFYIDDVNISIDNFTMDSTMHKYESNFSFISGLLISTNLYFSDIYGGNNYKIDNGDIIVNKKNTISLRSINGKFSPIFPDDYYSDVSLISYFIDIIKPINFDSIIGINLSLESRNGAVFFKNISIK